MSIVESSMVEVSMNKIALWIYDLTAEREIIASNGKKAEGLHAHDVSMLIPYFVNQKLYKAIKKAE